MKHARLKPGLFLGIADHVDGAECASPFPYGPLDAYRLSQHKAHIFFPAMIQSYVWILLIDTSYLDRHRNDDWCIKVVEKRTGKELGKLQFSETGDPGETASGTPPIPVVDDSPFTTLSFSLQVMVTSPGEFIVQSVLNGVPTTLGSAHFHYARAAALSPDQVAAINSDPNSSNKIKMELGCKHCASKLKVYTGIERSSSMERSGICWQADLPKSFKCECGATEYSLDYLRESMHGLLLKDFSIDRSGLSYVRRYGHQQVKNVVQRFNELIDREKLERPVQEFIEANPLLLARFHAARLFIQPNIIGRFQADFAVLDSDKQLWLIELEKPSLKLFRADQHPTQPLMHAYGQVTDWIHQYSKYPQAVLEGLGLKTADVLGVRGAVIAGRSKGVTHDVLQRHMENPPYPNIEFMTCDDLATSLLRISKSIA